MPVSVSQYFFGNSLVYHAAGGSYAAVPSWLDVFAEASSNTYAMNGSFGFLRSFADAAAPTSQWGFDGVTAAWDSDTQAFGAASFDSIVVTPANFIQDVSPTTNYVGDSRSPFDATLDIVNGVADSQPGAEVFIYEGWADMGPFVTSDEVATGTDLEAYHAYNQGAYHAWFKELTAQVDAATPGVNVTLLPVGSILSEALTTVLSDIPPDALYVDSAPHGTDTLYFLASMITYQGTYGDAPELPLDLPVNIHPDVIENFDALNALIATRLNEADATDASAAALDATTEVDDDEGVDTGSTSQTPPVVVAPVTEADPTPLEDETSRAGTAEETGPNAPPATAPASGETADTNASADPVVADPSVTASVAPALSAPMNEAAPSLPDAGTALDTGMPVETAPLIEPMLTLTAPSVSSASPSATGDEAVLARFVEVTPDTDLSDVDFSANTVVETLVDTPEYVCTTDALWEGGATDNAAAQFIDTINVPDGGTFRLNLVADDQAQLYVNGNLLLDTSGAPLETMQSTDVNLAPGQHNLEIRYLERGEEATLSVDVIETGPYQAQATAASEGELMMSLLTANHETEAALQSEGEEEGEVADFFQSETDFV